MKRKRCSKCGKLRLAKFFYKRSNVSDGLKSECQFCAQAYSETWKNTNRAKKFWKRWSRARRLKRYGLTEEQYVKLFRKQRGKCAVCRGTLRTKRRPHIDHSHVTKNVRGILCSNCNTLLGLAKDNISTLKRAIKYLIKHRRNQ